MFLPSFRFIYLDVVKGCRTAVVVASGSFVSFALEVAQHGVAWGNGHAAVLCAGGCGAACPGDHIGPKALFEVAHHARFQLAPNAAPEDAGAVIRPRAPPAMQETVGRVDPSVSRCAAELAVRVREHLHAVGVTPDRVAGAGDGVWVTEESRDVVDRARLPRALKVASHHALIGAIQ